MIIQVFAANTAGTGSPALVATLAVEAPNVTGGGPSPVGAGAPDVVLDPLPLPSEKRAVQHENLAFGDVAFSAERGNREVSLQFSVQSFFASRDTAMIWVLGPNSAADAVPPGANYDLMFTSDDGDSTAIYANGALAEVEVVSWVGPNCTVRWSFEGLTPP
jgi:hypothetical protein